MLRVEECEEAAQKEVVADGSRLVVLPNASALHHVALLNFWLCDSGLFFALGLFATRSSELSLEIVLDLLLGRLLLFLERGKVALCTFFLLTLLLLGRLLLLLYLRQ